MNIPFKNRYVRGDSFDGSEGKIDVSFAIGSNKDTVRVGLLQGSRLMMCDSMMLSDVTDICKRGVAIKD